MVEFIGMLKIKVVKGTNLAIRDMLSSDPYVVLTLGQQVRTPAPPLSVFRFNKRNGLVEH